MLRTTASIVPPAGLARIADHQRNARAEIADRRIALAPGIVLEELHAVVGIDHDDRVVGEPAGVEVTQHAADFIVELRDAAVIEIDDLIEVEFFLRRALAADDFERIGQLGHRELGFAGVGGVGEARVPRPFRRKGRVRRRIEDIQEERLRARGQAAKPGAARGVPSGW